MGVPKFFRWISERYPRINQPLDTHVLVPTIDHLYFDLNGIIHMCSHNNNDTLSMRMSDEEIFKNIERYMDVIVNEIIKPKESIVIAVDGVAPRAKLNQQRGRRFRSARERIHSMTPTDGSNGSGVDIADDHVFDSNCITPSTEFMVKLDLFLQDMIARKLGEAGDGDGDGDGSETWGGVRVVYSGHGVPGEGEHKIMQHIRTERAKPTYRANQRHCLYGQDADLLMLGLATHEPHFTILREVVVFKKTGNSNANLRFTTTEDSDEEDDNSLPLGLPSVEFVIPTASKFQLLHLSVLREYLEVEFSHKHYGSPLDRERLIDDFILLTFFVGNDFLPHLPALEINENAFDVIFDAYKSLQQEKVEYIVEDGEIANFARLEKFLSIIGEQEESILEKRALDVRIKALRVNNTLSKKQKKIQTQEIINLASVGGSNEGLLDKPSHGGTYQQKYYVDKFGNDATDLIQTDFSFSAHSIDTFVPCLVQEYVKGLIWCFKYYTKGCVSWNWYFPYHYGPMLKDVVNLEEISKKISFELSAPLLPYQQLLGCLPPSSAGLLPLPYQTIMHSDNSPMKQFYPMDFVEDMNGKHNSWEAVVLLPFINIDKLKEAVAEVENDKILMSSMTEFDRERNSFGEVLLYEPKKSATDNGSSLAVSNINAPYVAVERLQPINTPGVSFSPKMINGTIIPFDGFPSLRSLPIKYIFIRLLHHKAMMGMKYKTLILGVSENSISTEEASLRTILGQHVFVNYPMRHEAKVVGISNSSSVFTLGKPNPDQPNSPVDITEKKRDEHERVQWLQHASKNQEFFIAGDKKEVGTGTGGLAIGPVDTILTVLPVIKSTLCGSNGEKDRVYANTTAEYPLQLVQLQRQSPIKMVRADATRVSRPKQSHSKSMHSGARHFSSQTSSGVRYGVNSFCFLLRKFR